jgi:hypothetical protein
LGPGPQGRELGIEEFDGHVEATPGIFITHQPWPLGLAACDTVEHEFIELGLSENKGEKKNNIYCFSIIFPIEMQFLWYLDPPSTL